MADLELFDADPDPTFHADADPDPAAEPDTDFKKCCQGEKKNWGHIITKIVYKAFEILFFSKIGPRCLF